jgi:hypothetical protein
MVFRHFQDLKLAEECRLSRTMPEYGLRQCSGDIQEMFGQRLGVLQGIETQTLQLRSANRPGISLNYPEFLVQALFREMRRFSRA